MVEGVPQAGQMQALPRCASGTAARAAGAMGWVMHQQLSGGRPAAMAHWLGPPHSGQQEGLERGGVDMVPGRWRRGATIVR